MTALARDRSILRRLTIRRFLTARRIGNQAELTELLSEAGFAVTQSTVSRDLADLGAVKIADRDGHQRYVLDRVRQAGNDAISRLRKVLEDDLEAAIPSGNLLVLKVRVAAAHRVASALDACDLPGVIGTVAGDDTVLVATDDPQGGRSAEQHLMRLLED
jgi:transcriptional regulator of arginine metabolism